MPDREIHCSALPRLTACPASGLPDGPLVDSDGAEGRLGTACHELLAALIDGEPASIEAMAEMHDVDPRELAMLYHMGRQCWETIRGEFPEPLAEVQMSHDTGLGLVLCGTADVVSIVGPQIRLADWKTGLLESDATEQLKGYGLLALLEHPEAESVYACVVRVRDREREGYHWSRLELTAWWNRTLNRLLDQTSYQPGEQCRYCPRRLACPARSALVVESIRQLGDGSNLGLDYPSAVARTYDAVRTLEDACERARQALRFAVQDAGGKLDLGDGRTLTLTQQQQRKLDPRVALPILREYLAEQQLAECVTLAKGRVEGALKAGAGRGQKTAVVKEVFDRVEEQGGFVISTVERLEAKRVPQAIGAAT